MKTIYNTYIEVESQEQADRLKQVCIDNGLPIWKLPLGFEILETDVKPIFGLISSDFYIFDYIDLERDDKVKDFTKVTESEWLELLKTTK